jgi:hypothetical protein
MRKILFVFFISLVVANFSYSQEVNLYLLMAHPFYDAEPFPSYLLKLNRSGNPLDTVKLLSIGKEAIREVKYYPEQRKIIIVKNEWLLTNGNHKVIQFLNMDSPIALDSVQLDSLENRYLYSWLFNIKDQGTFFCVQLSNPNLKENDLLLGIDIKNFSIKKLAPEDFVYAEIAGNAGACLLTFDGLGVYTSSENGELRIPKTIDIAQRPIFPIQLPEEYQLHKKERRSIGINNSYAFVFSLNNSQASEKDLGFTDFAVLDKSSNSWFKQRIKGNYSGAVRSFDEWIAGTAYSNLNLFDEKGRLKDKIKRVSPGKDKRRQKISKTGMPADYRFDYFGVYSPGILYMLNVKTRDYLEWNTGQGDSEILLVENNEVYYRVNDEIYKAPILKGKKLGKAHLLIKNEIVPDIHWAFISAK